MSRAKLHLKHHHPAKSWRCVDETHRVFHATTRPLFGSRMPSPSAAAAASGIVSNTFEYMSQGDLVSWNNLPL
jgi:hypothetical protein